MRKISLRFLFVLACLSLCNTAFAQDEELPTEDMVALTENLALVAYFNDQDEACYGIISPETPLFARCYDQSELTINYELEPVGINDYQLIQIEVDRRWLSNETCFFITSPPSEETDAVILGFLRCVNSLDSVALTRAGQPTSTRQSFTLEIGQFLGSVVRTCQITVQTDQVGLVDTDCNTGVDIPFILDDLNQVAEATGFNDFFQDMGRDLRRWWLREQLSN